MDMTHNEQQRMEDDIPGSHIVEVFICDDDHFIREALKSLLSTYALVKADDPVSKIKVVGEAPNGREVLQMVANQQPDVILMDAQMPVMDGIEATRAIKANWAQVKIIVLTIYSAQEQAAMAAGADAFLLKGCPAEKLIDAILKPKEMKIGQA